MLNYKYGDQEPGEGKKERTSERDEGGLVLCVFVLGGCEVLSASYFIMLVFPKAKGVC